ncbi:MAG: hypothetical protein IJS54_05185, partial [Desulfovibrio sp.]|nr:hypothetical protein [Desulfovibrio sp.]
FWSLCAVPKIELTVFFCAKQPIFLRSHFTQTKRTPLATSPLSDVLQPQGVWYTSAKVKLCESSGKAGGLPLLITLKPSTRRGFFIAFQVKQSTIMGALWNCKISPITTRSATVTTT